MVYRKHVSAVRVNPLNIKHEYNRLQYMYSMLNTCFATGIDVPISRNDYWHILDTYKLFAIKIRQQNG